MTHRPRFPHFVTTVLAALAIAVGATFMAPVETPVLVAMEPVSQEAIVPVLNPVSAVSTPQAPAEQSGTSTLVANYRAPEPASAQDCGWCYNHVWYNRDYHSFLPSGSLFRCDNVGGCHLWWHVGKCRTYHEFCFLDPIGPVGLAIAERDSLEFSELLASSNNWEYDPTGRSLSFTCSGYAIARYVLPEELARVAINLWQTKRANATAQASEPQGGSE